MMSPAKLEGVPSPLTMSKQDKRRGERYFEFVQAYLAAGQPRSRNQLGPIIAAVHQERRRRLESEQKLTSLDAKPPAFTTALYYADRWAAHGELYGISSVVPNKRRGNTFSQFRRGLADRALDEGIRTALGLPGTANDALDIARLYVKEKHLRWPTRFRGPASNRSKADARGHPD